MCLSSFHCLLFWVLFLYKEPHWFFSQFPISRLMVMDTPNRPVSALLKLKILSWTHETGLPVLVRLQIADTIFNLHKDPLCSKSGYFKTRLEESNEINLPMNFPGGPETFEMIALFIYGSSTLVNPFNFASLRCAAEFLEMTEEYCHGNLCERFNIYLNQVVLQNWDDTLIVLQTCRNLLPLAEDLLIVSRCIESLAFMACMEILDPERRRDQPIVFKDWRFDRDRVKEILNQELWIQNLIDLPFGYFKRIIGSLRKQGMKEKYVVPIIVFFANKWILSKNYKTDEADDDVLMGVLHLLPMRDEDIEQVMIPVGFYFDLISISLEINATNEYMEKLMDQIVYVLHLATVDDLLYPKTVVESVSISFEFCLMQTIFRKYAIAKHVSVVAELWDCYLSRVASDSSLDPKRFAQFIETFPVSTRQSHDNLYRSLDTYLLTHPGLSLEEKGSICKYLNCGKLSHQVCIEAVQNELMPLRLIIQALFIQQINTHQVLFKDCSDSFRHSRTHLGSWLQEVDTESELSKKEYESTSFRIQNLEQELMSLKRSLQLQNIGVKVDQVGKKSGPRFGQAAAGCIGSVGFVDHKKYVARFCKVFSRVSFFRRG